MEVIKVTCLEETEPHLSLDEVGVILCQQTEDVVKEFVTSFEALGLKAKVFSLTPMEEEKSLFKSIYIVRQRALMGLSDLIPSPEEMKTWFESLNIA